MKVVEYVSTPGKDVCGKGMHSHTPHLTIMLTDALVTVTTPGGKVQNYDIKAGFASWFEADTHIVINNGLMPVRAYLIELKYKTFLCILIQVNFTCFLNRFYNSLNSYC